MIAAPHLGASTREAEEYCAIIIMIADQLRDYRGRRGPYVKRLLCPNEPWRRAGDTSTSVQPIDIE